MPYSLCKIDKGTTFKLKYIKERWHYFNAELFGSAMKEPNLQVDKAFKNPKTLGFWRPWDRVLLMAHKMFVLPTDKQILGTLVHEMAHQYDAEVLKTPIMERMIKRGHGPTWDHIMKSIGMPADATYAGDSDELLDEKQKENLDTRRATSVENPNKITEADFEGKQYIYAMWLNRKGEAEPIILVNRKVNVSSSGDVSYRGFGKSDIKSGMPHFVYLSTTVKPTAAQLRKFPSEFHTTRALELIEEFLNR